MESEVTDSHIIVVIVVINSYFGGLARVWADAPA